MAFLILLGIRLCFDEFYHSGSIIPDPELFFRVFSKSDKVFFTEITMILAHCLVVPLVIRMKNSTIG